MKALVAIANGTEEMEAVIVTDVLRRAGADVTVASVDDSPIVASRGVSINADTHIGDCTSNIYDLIVVPGGMPGAEHLKNSVDLTNMLKTQNESGRLIGAICAAPAVVLAFHGLLNNRLATCHPSFKDTMSSETYRDDRVIKSDNIITSQGAGTAIEFALILVECLYNQETSHNIAKAMCV